MPTKDTKGFFIRPERELINRLDRLSKEFKKGSANQVAVEVIVEYLDFWVEAEQARKDVLSKQQERFSKIKQEMLRQPLVEAKTEPITKPAAKRKSR